MIRGMKIIEKLLCELMWVQLVDNTAKEGELAWKEIQAAVTTHVAPLERKANALTAEVARLEAERDKTNGYIEEVIEIAGEFVDQRRELGLTQEQYDDWNGEVCSVCGRAIPFHCEGEEVCGQAEQLGHPFGVLADTEPLEYEEYHIRQKGRELG